jgi:hypothetical protein
LSIAERYQFRLNIDIFPEIFQARFDGRNMSYYTFHQQSDKPIKAVIRHLPIDTPAEGICNGLTELDFSIMSVMRLTANHLFREEGHSKPPTFPSKTTENTKINGHL